jgi:hypothetical protein
VEGLIMGQVLHSIENNPEHTVEIIVHITESLNEADRGELVSALENDEGITSAEFCPLHYHLMLVRYDRDIYSSQDVLGSVKAKRLNARLIGPV